MNKDLYNLGREIAKKKLPKLNADDRQAVIYYLAWQTIIKFKTSGR